MFVFSFGPKLWGLENLGELDGLKRSVQPRGCFPPKIMGSAPHGTDLPKEPRNSTAKKERLPQYELRIVVVVLSFPLGGVKRHFGSIDRS